MHLCNRYLAEPLESRVLLSVDAQPMYSAFEGMPAAFVPNRGQWDEAIRYAAHGAGADILFTDTGPTFRAVEQRAGVSEEIATVTRPATINEWSLTFVDAARVAPVGFDQQQTVFNYYLGDPSTWRTDVHSFGGVVYRDLWSGIDAHVMARDGGMKYEFHVDPGAAPQSIALRYNGVEGLSLNKSGGLSIRTPGGTITDDAPIAWQTRRDGKRVEVQAKFVLLDQCTYTISPTSAYDSRLPLVLDPQLAFGSYLGGAVNDQASDIAADGAGGVWITGETANADFPTPGGFDTTYNGGMQDAFVARVTAGGTLAFATFLGGSNIEKGLGIAADDAGGAWVTGRTGSSDFPTPGGFDTTYNALSDAFVAHISAAGTLSFASYLGGGHNDDGTAIISDGAGGAWLAGTTRSVDFPVPGGFDTTTNGWDDAFVARVTAAGTLAFASFLGGSDSESPRDIFRDAAGDVWLVGFTYSGNFPTPGGFDTTRGGVRDGFVARVTAAGTLGFASFLGGADGEFANGILVRDSDGAAWVTGNTSSTDFPTPGGFDTTFNGNTLIGDVFVVRIDAGGTLAFGSYLGGINDDWGNDIASDDAGGVWITGHTQSPNFPTLDGFDTTQNSIEAYVARVTAAGTLAASSFLGGSDWDYGQAIAPDGLGGAWITGTTSSPDLPTPGGFDTTYGGGDLYDAFVSHISVDTTAPNVAASQFAYDLAPQSIRFTFSENVSASLSLDDLTLENLTIGQTIPSGNMALSYNTASNIATITFPGYPYGALPNGTYRATLLAAGVTDAAGNPLPANHVLNFLFMLGDADNNGVINFDDYARIDNGFNNNLIGFSNGDFDYDGDVDFDDYAIVDLAFNSQ